MNKNKSQPKNQTKVVVPMRSIRDELGMTQSQLAAALNVDAMTISRAERGITEPVFTILQTKTLCKLLNKSIDDLPDYLGKDFLKNQK